MDVAKRDGRNDRQPALARGPGRTSVSPLDGGVVDIICGKARAIGRERLQPPHRGSETSSPKTLVREDS